MKKVFLVTALVGSLLFPTSAFGAIKSGIACKPLNTSKISGGIKYTCIKSKGKLVWNKGVAVAKPTVSATPTAEPTISPSTSPETTTASPAPSATLQVVKDVTAGAFCTPAGASGLTKTGLPVTCKTSATDTRNRWRQ